MAIDNLLDHEREARPAPNEDRVERTGGIPPAFYRDAGEPPPGDPHWREWPTGPNREPVPRVLLIGIPILLGVLGVLHIAVILLVLRLSGLY
ncbi:MAG TPA: hypothetical protein VNL35_23430 [Chloroflexota bacterium]|nr:hypothetical protein [Chloroflexota bacterium]